MKIVAAYVRVSTDDQTEYSPDSQIKMIQDYAKRNDMILPQEFIFMEDEGISGKKASKRPAFQHMIGIAKTKPKPFDAILLWKFSRFARNREDSIVYKSMLRKQLGIDVISISENVGDDKMSILIEAMIEAMDEYYSINLAEEVKRGMTEKVSRGEPVSMPAFGYDIQEKQYVINDNESPIIRMMYNDFIGGMGCRDIALKLNAMGIKTKRGNPFENRTVEYILRNPVYIGKIRWNPSGRVNRGESRTDTMIINSNHEPLISNETWEQTQRVIAQTKKAYPKYSRVRSDSEFMLYGLVKCSNCGSTLTKSTIGSLQCHLYAKGRCSISHSITISKMEQRVINAIEVALETGNFELIYKNVPEDSIDTDFVSRQIERENQKLIRIREAYQAGIDTLDEYKQNKEAIMKRIETLQMSTPAPKRITKREFIQKHKKSLERLKSEDVPPGEKNKIIRGFIEKVVFDRPNNQIQIFYYA